MRARRESASIPRVALAGYTNAGKSTLLNAITGAEVGVGDRLFHTLDPTTRSFEHGGRTYLLTDTVGFIEKLPHQLVEAFKATLEETILADLIVHVVDAAAPEERREADMRAVDEVLEEIGAGRRAAPAGPQQGRTCSSRTSATRLWSAIRDAVLVSALSGEGIEELRGRVEEAFAETLQRGRAADPLQRGGAPIRAARARRRAGARGARRRRHGAGPDPGRGAAPVRGPLRERRRRSLVSASQSVSIDCWISQDREAESRPGCPSQ